MTTTIQAQLEGSNAVSIEGRLYSYPTMTTGSSAGGPMARAARTLIRQGMDPETRVHLTKEGRGVFPEDSTLQQWVRALVNTTPPRRARIRKDPPTS